MQGVQDRVASIPRSLRLKDFLRRSRLDDESTRGDCGAEARLDHLVDSIFFREEGSTLLDSPQREQFLRVRKESSIPFQLINDGITSKDLLEATWRQT